MIQRKTHSILFLINNSLIDLPSPSNISYLWNFGSILGICLIIQIITGLFLSIHYCSDINISFKRISHITRDTNNGWLLRIIHTNGVSLFFIFLFTHIGRGIFYSSYYFLLTWTTGILIIFILIGTAFIGYVLPWGQIRFWGATVITNLLTAIPYLGKTLTYWIWGGFSVDNATLNRFFSLHFILPFILTLIIIFHITFLHETGSSNPLGTSLNIDKIPFHSYFSFKDILGFLIIIIIFIRISLIYPYKLCDPENFIQANPLVTPPHIQPEWYFLFAYAILRSIPNKLGGVIALFLSIIILILPPITCKKIFLPIFFNPLNKFLFFIFINNFFLLTFLGACPVEQPYIFISQIITITYFIYFLYLPFLKWLIINNYYLENNIKKYFY